MTPEAIAALVGFVVSLALEYIPVFKDWYNGLTDTYQRLLPLGVGIIVVYVAFGLGCFGLLAPYWPCDGAGAWAAFLAWVAYVLANQATYALFFKKDK